MFDLYFYNIVMAFFIILILYGIYIGLQKLQDHRQLSLQLPSVTKCFWSELKFSIMIAKKHPKDIIPLFTKLFNEYGPIFHVNISGRHYVMLNDPDDIKILLSSAQNINKGSEYDLIKPWLKEGLITSSGSKWQSRRKLLTNTFHFKNLEAYNKPINKHSRVLIKKLLEASATDKEIDILEYLTLCSLDMICETITNTEINTQLGGSIKYVHSIETASRLIMERVFKFWLWNDWIFKLSGSGRQFYKSIDVLHNFTNEVIKNKQISLNNSQNQKIIEPQIKFNKGKQKSFLDILHHVLKKYPHCMTHEDIQEEVDTFILAGHDTIAVSLTMTLILLGIHQNVQDKVREEINLIFGDSDRDVTMEDLNIMKYLDAVVKESLRLYPSVPVFTRQLQTMLNIANYNIPPKTTVVVFPYILHRKEDIFYKSEEFIPERFLNCENKSKFQFGYLPFSAGSRNCIGQKYAMNKMKTVLMNVLRKIKIVTLGNKDDIKISMQIVIRIESLPKIKLYKI